MRRFEYVYSFAPMRPPRVSATTFTSYICCIYTLKFGQYWTLLCIGSSSVSSMPCMQFLFVRPRLCRGLPSDSTSRWTPLPLANSSYCQVCSGLSPPSDSACRAHYNKSSFQSLWDGTRTSVGIPCAYSFADMRLTAFLPPSSLSRQRRTVLILGLSFSI